jgi:hypothetical protein
MKINSQATLVVLDGFNEELRYVTDFIDTCVPSLYQQHCGNGVTDPRAEQGCQMVTFSNQFG